jgi:hypothetical protein
MRSFARIAAGLLAAAVPLVVSGAPAAHADTLLNQTCTGTVSFTFTPFLSAVYNAPYERAYNATCDSLVVIAGPGVQLQSAPHAGVVVGQGSGTCATLVLTGDYRNGVGLLIGGSVVVAGSAFPLTGDLAFAEVDVMTPQGIPCLSETGASGVSFNDTVL